MIINIKKHLFLGAKEEIDRFFSAAQQEGIIEFISPTGRKEREFPPQVQQLLHAIKILRKLPVKDRYKNELNVFEAEEMAEKIIELKSDIERLSEEKRIVEAEITRVAPFGDFNMEDVDFIERASGMSIRFFCAKSGKPYPEPMIYVGTEYDLDYFIAFDGREGGGHFASMIEMRIDRPLGELETQLSFIQESLYQMEAELKGFTGHMEDLRMALITCLNEYHLDIAKRDLIFPEEDSMGVFAVEAWIPENKTKALTSLMEGMAIHCEVIAVEEADRVPTYMENRGTAKLGEDLVKIYDAPAVSDRDPSRWVFWFFSLFFAMIVADGGYGLLYLGILLYVKWKYPVIKEQGKRFLKMAFILSGACVIWGVATAAFFGIEVHPKSWIGEMSVIQHIAIKKADYHLAQKDDVYADWVARFPQTAQATTGAEVLSSAVVEKKNKEVYPILDEFSDRILLEFSLLIGVIHVALSFLRYLFRNWAGAGWVAFMIGAYLYFPETLNATSIVHFVGGVGKEWGRAFGLQLIYCGGGAALLLALLQKRLKGLGEVANLVQIVADVLSYLRLYALGLAGSIMAATFNSIGEDIGLLFGWAVILCGHGVNITLGLMAGVIHGLRLNFIEWYHYCFNGGGRFFNPLRFLKNGG